ncbi:unnamed protein product [Rotaria sordida]|uniref:Uncharacterized protein n=1 Tax=Rotaria sordida TaxID=392033 RepID=A0A814EMF0_9BILA|nr:unnamed protein product [Rotaria sordida]CAF1016434.1 unnamed protein product [Rotaria sordida]
MPEIGTCTDTTCDDGIKELYECHCCSRLVCLNHLIEHVEITQQNKRQLDSLHNELNTVINTLKLIVEQKLFTIGHEQYLIDLAQRYLEVPDSSIDELQSIFEQVNQAIASNRSETMVKVEPPLSETRNCSCVCKCNKTNMDSNDQSPLRITPSPAESVVHSNATIDTDVTEESVISENAGYSTYIDHDYTDVISIDETIKSVEDQHLNKKRKKRKRISRSKIFAECPLTFDGAYGLTQANHSIKFCEHGKKRRVGIYQHFLNKHKLKEVYAQRLIRAVADNQDPKITELFDGNEDVIDHFYRVQCPFTNGRVHLPGYSLQSISNVPCRRHLVPLNALKYHLRKYHHASQALAQKLLDDFKKIRTKK